MTTTNYIYQRIIELRTPPTTLTSAEYQFYDVPYAISLFTSFTESELIDWLGHYATHNFLQFNDMTPYTIAYNARPDIDWHSYQVVYTCSDEYAYDNGYEDVKLIKKGGN